MYVGLVEVDFGVKVWCIMDGFVLYRCCFLLYFYLLVVFDFDGMLVDSVVDIVEVLNCMLEDIGMVCVLEVIVFGWIGDGVCCLVE